MHRSRPNQRRRSTAVGPGVDRLRYPGRECAMGASVPCSGGRACLGDVIPSRFITNHPAAARMWRGLTRFARPAPWTRIGGRYRCRGGAGSFLSVCHPSQDLCKIGALPLPTNTACEALASVSLSEALASMHNKVSRNLSNSRSNKGRAVWGLAKTLSVVCFHRTNAKLRYAN